MSGGDSSAVEAAIVVWNRDDSKVMQRRRDKAKYGNPNGPDFAYLVEKNRKKGLEGDAVYEAIVESSSRTSAAYNKKMGVKREGG